MFQKFVAWMLVVALGVGLFWGVFDRAAVGVVSYVGNKKIPIYRVDRKEISLTFDSAWPVDDIPKILEVLRKNNIKATFFLLGIWVDQFPDTVKLIEKEGHDIACHGYTHKNMTTMQSGVARQELSNFKSRIKQVIGKDSWKGMDLFRAPSGAWNENVVDLAAGEGLFTVQWDVDTLDYKKETTQEDIINRVLEKTKPGSIILMHNGTQHTANALDSVIKELKKANYKFLPVSEMIFRENYSINSTGEQQKTT